MSKPAWVSVNLGEVTSESRKRAGNNSGHLDRTVYGVDHSVGLILLQNIQQTASRDIR